jgi:hypothetical protein
MPASEHADAIRKLAKRGLSGGQIAKTIKCGLTRDMICGWCRRNGVKLPQTNAARRKLTDDQVREIRASVEPYSVLSARYSVNKGIISMVKARRTYKDVV